MEYELFRSKLKPSVDGALISGVIRRSSSGLNSHRTAVMELVIEGSIQERRERMFEKAKNNPRPQPLPNDTTGTVTSLVSASAEYETSQDSSGLLKPAKKIEGVARCEEPPTDVKTNPSPSKDPVEQECGTCHLKTLESCLYYGACPHCYPAGNGAGMMKCIGCGTIRLYNVDACSGCYRKFN